jgi:peptide/nickel transport system substrate-binding protein
VSLNRNELTLDSYNLSQYASFEADSLLETIRGKTDDRERAASLSKLRDVLKRDIPAVFLYSPLYTFAHREDILGIELKSLSLHSDRFLTLYHWYVKQERVFKPGKSWWSFIGWLTSMGNDD